MLIRLHVGTFVVRKWQKQISHDVVHVASFKDQGPVFQNVVSLTSSLRVISLTVLADSLHSILILFAEKM